MTFPLSALADSEHDVRERFMAKPDAPSAGRCSDEHRAAAVPPESRSRSRTDGAARVAPATDTCGSTKGGLDPPRPTVALLARGGCRGRLRDVGGGGLAATSLLTARSGEEWRNSEMLALEGEQVSAFVRDRAGAAAPRLNEQSGDRRGGCCSITDGAIRHPGDGPPLSSTGAVGVSCKPASTGSSFCG